ncbi:hypothetical protein BJY01DRAFT_255797 [Aspergillus pseudoustus]|uniref:NACHT domain-containing protein n=1 Tax=Aspergillus pseudoustus TaxID=1810923 RepID=A0ABR4IH92_9EURO
MAERRRDRLWNKLGVRGTKPSAQSPGAIGALTQSNAAVATVTNVTEPQKLQRVSTQPASVTSIEPSPKAPTDNKLKSDEKKESLWKKAYDRLRGEAPELVEDYLKLLANSGGKSEGTDGPAQVANVVDKQKKIMEDKHWKLAFWHREIVIREKVDHIVQAYNIFKGLGPAIASLDAVHAGIPWAGVCVLLHLVANDSEQHTRVLDGLVSITDLMNFYTQAEEFYIAQDVNPKPLIDLYTLILEFQMLAAGYFSRNTAVRFTRNILMLDDWSDKLSKAQLKNAECRDWVNLAISGQIIHELKVQLSTVNDDAAEAQEILQWISSISVRDQHVFVRESKLTRPYWNNGKWLLEHSDFRRWLHAPSGILYLEGVVGVGKSCLVSAVIEHHFERSLDRLAFFYCSRSVADSFDALTILRSLLAQLSYTAKTKEIPEAMHKRYKDQGSNINGGSLSIRDCEDHIIDLASRARPITVIVDALDECADHHTLLNSLKRIYGRSSYIHLFFSSRPIHINLADYFDQFSPISITVIDQSRHEMEAFIDREIWSPNRRRNSCIETCQELEGRFRNALVDRAGAMFRWAELQLDVFLSEKRPIRHWKDFEHKLNKLISDPSLPTLTRAYDEIYSANVEAGRFSETCAVKALQCILAAFQPLTIRQLVEAVAIDSTGARDSAISRSYIMDVCNNLIVVDIFDIVSLAHLSVREYLEQKPPGDSEHQIYASVQTHRQLAECCLATVLHASPGDFAGRDFGKTFLIYAVTNWPAHCEAIHQPRKDGCVGPLMEAMMTGKLSEWASLVTSNLRRALDLAPRSDEWRLKKIPITNTYAYVVCAWGFDEFFNSTIKGTEPLDVPFASYRDPLEVASRFGKTEIVRRILMAVSIDDISQVNSRPLERASMSGHYQVVRLLLGAGMDPTEGLEPGFMGDFDSIVQLVINHAVKVDVFSTRKFQTVLESQFVLACGRGWLNIVKTIFATGVSFPHLRMRAALEYASLEGHLEITRFLLDNDANAIYVGGLLASALCEATKGGHLEIMKTLLERGADPSMVSEEASPLDIASSSSLELVQLLIKSGADVNGPEGLYGAPLRSAIKHGQLEIVRLLLDCKAEINVHADGEEGPLIWAAAIGNSAILQLLIERGGDLAKYGPDAYKEASLCGRKNTLRLLAQHGVEMPEGENEDN